MMAVANSTRVTTQDVAIRASGYMAVSEIDGHGEHTYLNVSVTPGPGRLITVNADGFHSEDVDHGPLIGHHPLTITIILPNPNPNPYPSPSPISNRTMDPS